MSILINNYYITSEFELHFTALIAGVEASRVLINVNTTDEIFTNDIYDDLMALINFYKGTSNPENIDSILSSLESDLIINKNKSKSEVLSFLND